MLIFKATQTVNFAQGAIALVGAWFASLLLIDWRSPAAGWATTPTWCGSRRSLLAALMTAVLGLIIERLAIRPMIGEPLFSVAVITLGLEAILRTIGFDAVNLNPRSLAIPWGFDGFNVGDAFVAWTYVAIYIATAIAFVAIFFFFRTRLGIAMRAVAFDQEAALAQGISVGKVFAVAWGVERRPWRRSPACSARALRSAAASVSAGITGLAFRALPAVILGGLDSVSGALDRRAADRVRRGVLRSSTSPTTRDTLGNGYSLIVPYIVMLVVLLVRPYGLFGTPEIRRV